jgi:hypothetical protein
MVARTIGETDGGCEARAGQVGEVFDGELRRWRRRSRSFAALRMTSLLRRSLAALRMTILDVRDNGLGQRVGAEAFGRGGVGEERFAVKRGIGGEREGGDDGLAEREGSCLVERYGVDRGEAFERFAALDEQPRLGGAAERYSSGGRHGEPHGAGAGDDERRNGDAEGTGDSVVPTSGVAGDGPDGEGERGQPEHGGNENGGGTVGQALHGGTAGLRLGQQALHLGQR